MNKHEVDLLRQEIELLMVERARLLKITGAAALLVSSIKADSLPTEAVISADVLSESLNNLTEETLKEALEIARAVAK